MTTTETSAPWSPPPAFQPEPVQPRPRRRLGLVLMLVVSLLALAAVSTYAVLQHGSLSDSRAQSARLTTTLGTTQHTLKTTRGDLASVKNSLSDAKSTISQCKVAINAARHETHGGFHAISALGDDVWTKITDLHQGIADLRKANAIITRSGSTSIWALYDSCSYSGVLS